MPKWRRKESYARRAPVREPYDTVLIVCEGEKTEPNYLNRLREVHRLSSANIRVVPAPGSDPMSVVTHAETELERGDYDCAFCVFDRDSHANFNAAIEKINASMAGKAGKLSAIVSWPCFEVWVLLHFIYTTQPFSSSGGRSPCENVIRTICKHFPEYTKGYRNVYDDLKDNLPRAIKHGQQLEKHNMSARSKNPSTDMHKLVRYLLSLRPEYT